MFLQDEARMLICRIIYPTVGEVIGISQMEYGLLHVILHAVFFFSFFFLSFTVFLCSDYHTLFYIPYFFIQALEFSLALELSASLQRS